MTVAGRSIIRPPRGPFAFPGTARGFNQSHMAANRVRFSAVAFGGTFVQTGGPTPSLVGTNTGSPTAAIRAPIGQAISYPTTGGSRKTAFAGQSSAADTVSTMAAIFELSSVATNNKVVFCDSNTTNTGKALGCVSTTGLLRLFGLGGTSATSTLAIVASTPYFAAASTDGSAKTTFVLVNLRTGQILTEQVAAAPSNSAPDGTCLVGNAGSNNSEATGFVSAVAHSGLFLSLTQLAQWGADPWSFWYPR